MSESTSDLFRDPEPGSQGAVLLTKIIQNVCSGAGDMAFACGGSVPIGTSVLPNREYKYKVRPTPPVTVWWERQGENPLDKGPQLRRTVFPADPNGATAVSELVGDCQASVAVSDASFCPYKSGIMEVVTPMMLEGYDEFITLGVRAELQVHSSSGSNFESVVDYGTDEDDRLATLIVCLPHAFSGGNLEVRRAGQTVTFDWSAEHGKANEIQWAAFYTNAPKIELPVESQVMEVTSGHRVTLTYHLYDKSINENSQRPAVPLPFDSKSSLFYKWMLQLMERPEFLRHGGLVGIHCVTSYAHHNSLHYKKIKHMLKGSDAIIYRCLLDIPGVEVRLLPVLEKSRMSETLEMVERALWNNLNDVEAQGAADRDGAQNHPTHEGTVSSLWKRLHGEEAKPVPETYDQYTERIGDPDASWWKWCSANEGRFRAPISIVGKEMMPWNGDYEVIRTDTDEDEEELMGLLNSTFPSTTENIQWLNNPGNYEIAVSWMDDSYRCKSNGIRCSSLAFIIRIPPFETRQPDHVAQDS
ncbi:hypothetical protein B0I35DRAFT_463942 [Stachybotrys elegans]|uniref:Uncharacterized protein n=1 Tax=Stachybotrys elegans TaxID=80388 RepID=A0A8K0WNB1_9HYPO|nr:hypothetical protein B0I35DRAFT_463942 [Stachybotrys elegans]